MMLPTIHLNGTSPGMLLGGYENARFAVSKAIEAMEAIEFNARDYYPQGPDAWNKAATEQAERYSRLLRTKTELETIEMHVIDAIDAREAQKR